MLSRWEFLGSSPLLLIPIPLLKIRAGKVGRTRSWRPAGAGVSTRGMGPVQKSLSVLLVETERGAADLEMRRRRQLAARMGSGAHATTFLPLVLEIAVP